MPDLSHPLMRYLICPLIFVASSLACIAGGILAHYFLRWDAALCGCISCLGACEFIFSIKMLDDVLRDD